LFASRAPRLMRKDVRGYSWFGSRDVRRIVDLREQLFFSPLSYAKMGGESHVGWWCFLVLPLFFALHGTSFRDKI